MPRRVWRPQASEATLSSNSSSLPPKTTWAWGEPDVEYSLGSRPRTASVDTLSSLRRSQQSEPLRRAQTSPGYRQSSKASALATTSPATDEPPGPSSSNWAVSGLDRVRRQMLELAVDRLRGQPLRQVALQVAKRSGEQQQRGASVPFSVDPTTFSLFSDLVERTFPGSGDSEGCEDQGYVASSGSSVRRGPRRNNASSTKGRSGGDRARVDALLDVYLQATTGGSLNTLLTSVSSPPVLALAVLTCAVGYDAALPSVSRRLSVNYSVALPSSFSNTPKKDDLPGLKLLFKLVESSGLISHLSQLDQELFRRTVTKLLTSIQPDNESICAQFVESLHSLQKHHMLLAA